MPDAPAYPKRAHPGKRSSTPPYDHERHGVRGASPVRIRYAELRCQTNFSFLRGASHPEELAERAAELGYAAMAITDRNTLAGVVRMHAAAKARNLKLIVGAEITPVDAPRILLYATDRAAYGRLCRVISQGRLRSVKGSCSITLDDLAQRSDGLIGAICGNELASSDEINAYRDVFGDRLYLAVSVHGGVDDERYLARMAALSKANRVPLVATNDVHYHDPQRRFLQDVLTCIREHCTVESAGTRLFANAERHLKSTDAMARLFADCPGAVARTVEVADRCTFSLDELRYEYPEALCPADRTPTAYLAELTWAGAERRYAGRLPEKVRTLLEHELSLIRKLKYEPYFLTVWDIVQFARSRDILCQGRGSAANSAVCYCLGITSVDPDRIDLLFERFLSPERNEPPDIDVDFEHERREEVFQYIYDKYGREHAGIVAEVITYRSRSAIRDVGKALGLSLDRIAALAKKHEWWDRSQSIPDEFLREAGFDPGERTIRLFNKLVPQLLGFPRHLSQHVGGFVITRGPLCEMVPIENAAMPERTFIEWDKDDIDALGILKIDCLALGMLTAIHKCFQLLGEAGTEGRRDEGTEGRRDEGTERAVEEEDTSKRIRWTARIEWNTVDVEVCGGTSAGEDLSRFDFVAQERRPCQGRVSAGGEHAAQRAIRVDSADATSRCFDCVEHCRGEREGNDQRLSSLSCDVAGISRRAGNAAGYHPGTKADQEWLGPHGPCCRGGSPAPRIDPQPSEQTPIHGDRVTETDRGRPFTSGLCCRCGGSPFSRPSVPPSLRSSVPRSLSEIPPEDPVVYAMIQRADTVGVFQIESRAQMSMLPRLKPRNFYDLVIEVAIVRPGPIQGGMVHPYLRRRNGEEAVTYPNEAIEQVLHRTLGVPLFQEQAMRLAVVAAGFTPGEADQLRRAMAAWRRHGEVSHFRTKLIEGMKGNGLSEEFAERCYKQICGFGEYGFPESHAASFALLVYVSAWLKRYHPAAFCAAILNSMPMGFYQPAQLVRDAREHGVDVLPVDVNESGYDCRLEGRREEGTKGQRDGGTEGRKGGDMQEDPSRWGVEGPAVRLGMRLVKGVSRAQVESIEREQSRGRAASVSELSRRTGVGRATLTRLAAADAMRSMGLNRREALWQVLALGPDPEMFQDQEWSEPKMELPTPSDADIVLGDYATTGLSLHAHPLSLIRGDLTRLGVQTSAVLRNSSQGRGMRVAGVVLVRQRPTTAGGIVFCTLEDEAGTANLIIPPAVYEKYRRAARGAAILIAEGRVERQGEVVHLHVRRLEDFSLAIWELAGQSRDFH